VDRRVFAHSLTGEPPDKERSRVCRKAFDYIRANPQPQGQRLSCPKLSATTELPPPLLNLIPEPALPPKAAQQLPHRAVLDTQVVLDWLVFHDPSCAALALAVARGSLRWLTSQAMRAELEHVLDRGVAAAWGPDRVAIAQAFDRHAQTVLPSVPPGQTLRCTDPDDQIFIDLALASGAEWLFTRDRALLRLARRARERGLTVLRPVNWEPSMTPAPRP
jgi:predicted nucleic acid-binding protein